MKTWSLATILSLSACVVRTRGWVSVKDAHYSADTASYVCGVLEGTEPIPEIEQRDCNRASEILPWLNSREDLTPYDKGLREALRACDGSGVSMARVPYICTAVIAYRDGLKSYDKRDKWASLADSDFVGRVGGQLRDLDLTVTNKVEASAFKTSSGVKRSHIYTMRASDGTAYKWMTDKDMWVIDDPIHISSARIKEHAEYKGRRFTELKNCRTREVVRA